MKSWIKYTFRPWFNRRVEKFQMSVAWWTPRWLAYWCTIRVGAHATTGEYSMQNVPELTFADALKRWK